MAGCRRAGMTIVFRLFAWLLAAAVTFATIGPPRFRPHSSLGQDGEHTLAFVMIGVIEILQIWAPGRHARLEDFVVDAIAASVGFAMAAVLGWLTRQARPTPT